MPLDTVFLDAGGVLVFPNWTRISEALARHDVNVSPRALADAIGFRYAYDRVNKQYAHPSGIVTLTSKGRISRYFFGVNFPANELSDSLKQARGGDIGPKAPALLMLCSKFMTLTGPYSQQILTAVRALAVLSVVAFLAFVILKARQPGGVA